MPLSPRKYRLVALGGTFDVLHAGHRRLLSEAFEIGDTVLIGVTSDRLVRSLRKNHSVRQYSQRVRDIRKYLRVHRWSTRAKLSKLSEPYGPAARRRGLQALIVSGRTLESGRRLNKLRKKIGLRSLDLRVVSLVAAADGKPISTTRIRNEEIDLRGRLLERPG